MSLSLSLCLYLSVSVCLSLACSCYREEFEEDMRIIIIIRWTYSVPLSLSLRQPVSDNVCLSVCVSLCVSLSLSLCYYSILFTRFCSRFIHLQHANISNLNTACALYYVYCAYTPSSGAMALLNKISVFARLLGFGARGHAIMNFEVAYF